MTKLRDYLRISDAAEYLGVSPNTLRNWERADKFVAHRHPGPAHQNLVVSWGFLITSGNESSRIGAADSSERS